MTTLELSSACSEGQAPARAVISANTGTPRVVLTVCSFLLSKYPNWYLQRQLAPDAAELPAQTKLRAGKTRPTSKTSSKLQEAVGRESNAGDLDDGDSECGQTSCLFSAAAVFPSLHQNVQEPP